MYRKLTLKDLGANKCINLLKPMKCICGCGDYAKIIIENDEDCNVFTIARSLLQEADCNHAWIFVIESWAISGAYTSDEGIQYFSIATPENEEPIIDFDEQVKLVKSIIKDVRPRCIGVLQITADGTFRVVTDRVYDRR